MKSTCNLLIVARWRSGCRGEGTLLGPRRNGTEPRAGQRARGALPRAQGRWGSGAVPALIRRRCRRTAAGSCRVPSRAAAGTGFANALVQPAQPVSVMSVCPCTRSPMHATLDSSAPEMLRVRTVPSPDCLQKPTPNARPSAHTCRNPARGSRLLHPGAEARLTC